LIKEAIMASKEFKNSGWNQGIYEESAVQLEELGTLRIMEDGRKFRYARAGDAITVGKAVEGSAITVANLTAQTVTAALAVGDTGCTFTAGGGLTYDEDYFVGGFYQVTEGVTGVGSNYRIEESGALAAGTALTLTFSDAVHTAIDATAKATVIANDYCYIITAATITNPVIGVTVFAASAANKFVWVQTGGTACVLNAGNTAIGTYLIANATDGALSTSAMAATSPIVGYANAIANATTKYYPVMLTID